MATAGYLVHQENMLSQALDNVKDLRDALALERRANDGEVSALHQKSGQHADPSVNKTFLASF